MPGHGVAIPNATAMGTTTLALAYAQELFSCHAAGLFRSFRSKALTNDSSIPSPHSDVAVDGFLQIPTPEAAPMGPATRPLISAIRHRWGFGPNLRTP